MPAAKPPRAEQAILAALADAAPEAACESLGHAYPTLPATVSMPLAAFLLGYADDYWAGPEGLSAALSLAPSLAGTGGADASHVASLLLTGVASGPLADAIDAAFRDIRSWADSAGVDSALPAPDDVDLMLRVVRDASTPEIVGNGGMCQTFAALDGLLRKAVQREFQANRVVAERGVIPATAAYGAASALFQFECAVRSLRNLAEEGDARALFLAARDLGHAAALGESALAKAGRAAAPSAPAIVGAVLGEVAPAAQAAPGM